MTHDPIHVTDCQTGITTTREPTVEEVAGYERDAKEQAKRVKAEEKARAEAEERRASILSKLADGTGFSPEEVAEAIRA